MVGPNCSLFLQSVSHPFYGVLLLKKKKNLVYFSISQLKILILYCFKLYSCSYLYFLSHCSLPVASLMLVLTPSKHNSLLRTAEVTYSDLG